MSKLSVVIPLYNKAPHIERAIDSVLDQTETDFELIVIDDGSTDNGGEIVSGYTDKSIKLISQKNQGVSAARNRGIKEAKTELIAFLDADDEWEKDHLETILRLYRKYPEAGAYATAYCYVKQNGEILPAKIKAIPTPPWEGIIPDYFKSAALGKPPVWSSSVAIQKAIFKQVGYFKEGISRGEDLDMWGRIALCYKIAFSWRGISFYRLDASARACVQTKIEKHTPFIATVEESCSIKAMPYFLKYYVNNMKFKYIEALADSGNRIDAFKELSHVSFMYSRKYLYLKALAYIILPKEIVKFLKFVKELYRT